MMSTTATTSTVITPSAVGAILWLVAPHTTMGNPRRLAIVLSRSGLIVGRSEDNYKGENLTVCEALGLDYTPWYDLHNAGYPHSFQVDVSATEYKHFLKLPVYES
jgi:hypothetical protein